MQAARHGLTSAGILDALADDRFVSLVNEGDKWRLTYRRDGESGTLDNADLDSLLADWCDQIAKWDAAA